MSTHLQTPPVTCGIVSWGDSISQVGETRPNTVKSPHRAGQTQLPTNSHPDTLPNPRQEAPASSPVPPLCLNTQHPPVLPPAPEYAQPAPSVEEVSDALSQWPVAAGGKCLMPPPHFVPQSSQRGSTLEHRDPASSPPCLMAPPLFIF